MFSCAFYFADFVVHFRLNLPLGKVVPEGCYQWCTVLCDSYIATYVLCVAGKYIEMLVNMRELHSDRALLHQS